MIDVYASQPHYYDHLAPIHRELGGALYLPRQPWSVGRLLFQGRPRTMGLTLVAGFQDVVTVERSGGVAILLEHGTGQTYDDDRGNPSYPGGRRRDHILAFLCTNLRVAAANAEAYPTIPAEIIGSPRLDELAVIRAEQRIPSDVGRPVLGVTWHWDCRVSRECGWAFPEWGEAMRELVLRWPGPVIGSSHPRSLLNAARWYERVGIELVPDWSEMVRRVDVLSFDNTSAGYEAAALGIPVVLLGSSRWRSDAAHGLRFYDHADIGPNRYPTGRADLDGEMWAEAAWEAYDETERFAPYIDRMVDDLYPHRGEATERAVIVLRIAEKVL